MPRRLLLALLTCTTLAAADTGTYAAWQAHRDRVLQDPSVVRYYTFEDVADAKTPVANQAGKVGALTYQLVDAAHAGTETLAPVAGRWPQKKAVRLDRGVLSGEPFAVSNKQFSVEAWFRKLGPGSLTGNPGTVNGTLLSHGIGFWDGWRVTCNYPDQTMALEIGRPNPVNAIGTRTGAAVDGLWHHLVASWNGQEIRLYLDGRLRGRQAYAGDYYPPQAGAPFKIGFAGYGIGSARLEFDEVIVRNRPLAALEVLTATLLDAPLPAGVRARLETAAAAFERQDTTAALASFGELARLPAAPADVRLYARLQRTEILRDGGRTNEARTELVALLDDPATPDAGRHAALLALAQVARRAGEALPSRIYQALLKLDSLGAVERHDASLSLARALRAEGRPDEARQQYDRVLALPETTARERLDLRLELGHSCCQARAWVAARTEYQRIAADATAPAIYRTLARLRVAETYVGERNTAAARAALAAVAALPDAPDHLRAEARERSRELERLAAGQPARDPAADRTAFTTPRPAVNWHVSPQGRDTAAGTAAQPFATLARARQALRDLKAKGPLAAGGVAVLLGDGVYRSTETFTLTAEDSGTAAAPVVWRAAPGSHPVLHGGARLTGWRPVTDAAILARLQETARGQVQQVDLRANGVTDFSTLQVRGYGGQAPPAVELFLDGRPQQPARWPNTGFVNTGKVLDEGQGTRGATFGLTFDRAARWTQAPDVWLYGYWKWHWADCTLAVAKIDLAAKQIQTRQTTGYGVAEAMPFYAFNLLEEIDTPGEWYLDRATGTLYLWPPGDLTKTVAELSVANGPMVKLDGASHVILQGLTIELGRSNGVEIHNGEECLVAGCTIRRLGGMGVMIDGGRHHGVLSCDLATLGRHATWVKGGERLTLKPGEHFVENCYIHDFSRVDRTYTPAFWTDGCGNRFAHNLVHDSPCHAMRLEGNDHQIEFNEIHSVVYESDDQGGADIWQNPTYRGVVFRYNYWHHIGSGHSTGQAGIRLDDAISGVLMYGNVFYKCASGWFGGVQIHGGKDNIVDNNLFVDCRYAVSFSGWGEQNWRKFITQGVKGLIDEVKVDRPPYSTRYPALQHLLDNEGVNSVWRNVAVDCGDLVTRDRGIQDLADNLTTGQDPGFVDRANGNLAIRPNSPVLARSGFRPIPFEAIGLYRDPLRPSWPGRTPITDQYRPE